MKAQQGVEVWLYSFSNHGSSWGWAVNATDQLLYPMKKTKYPLYRRLGELQDWSGWLQEI
jgi:hypothetical protein